MVLLYPTNAPTVECLNDLLETVEYIYSVEAKMLPGTNQ